LSARRWFDVHSFTGVFTGIMLLIICWGGTVATLSFEFDWLMTPEMRVQPFEGEIDWDAVGRSVLEEFPGAKVQMFLVPPYQRSAIEVVLARNDRPRTRVFVDPSNAEVLGVGSMANVQRFFRSFHRRLFFPNPIGIIFVSLFAISLAVSITSALLFYKRWWSKFLRFKPGKKNAWVTELHKTGGLWVLVFAILIAVTGIWYGLEATGVPHSLFAKQQVSEQAITEQTSVLTVNELTAIAQQARPDLEIRQIFPPGSFFGDARLRVAGKGDDWFLRDWVNSVTVSDTGVLIKQQSGADLTSFEYWENMADPLHFGNFAGITSKIIWFLFGLMLSGLCLSGLYLHAKRLFRQGGFSGRAYWRGTASALVCTILVVLISVFPGIDEIVGYLGDSDPTVAGIPMAPGVRRFIIGWILLTLAVIILCFTWIWRAGTGGRRPEKPPPGR